MSIKTFVFDVETTGTRYWRNCIHQLAGAIMIDGEIKEYFNFRVRPHESAEIETEALNYSNVTVEQIMMYEHRTSVYIKLICMLEKYVNRYDPKDKMFLLGFNNQGFDDKFLRTFFQHEGDTFFDSWFWSGSIDVMVLAAQHLMLERHNMPSFKQHRVAKTLGIEVDDTKLHDAKYDVHLLLEIYKRVAAKPVDPWML